MQILCRWLALSRRELMVLLAIFVVSLPAVTPRIYASDEIEYFSYLRSLWFDHDVSFDNEYRYFYDRNVARAEGFHETFLEGTTDAGLRPNFGTIGCALLWSPFYAGGDAAARIARALGRDVPVDGLSRPYVAAVAYGSAVYGFLAVLLSIGAARRLLPGREGLRRVPSDPVLGGILVWLGTPLLFYMYVAPPMSHACSAFAVALFVSLWLHVRQTWTVPQVVALGAAGALMAMVREQDIFFAAGPALDFVITQVDTRRTGMAHPGPDPGRRSQLPRGALTAVAGCVAFVLAFLPQLVAYRALNGHVWPSRVVTRKMTWTAPHAMEVLASTAHGFLFWTPIAVFAIAGLVALARRGPAATRRVSLIALLMIALQVYVGGSVESWSVAGAFGQRRFVALTILLGFGLAGMVDTARHSATGRSMFVAAAALCVWWNLGLIALFGTGLMNRQQLELGRNAYAVFVTLPRTAPRLAYRYMVDRRSFYRTAPGAPVP